VGFSFCLSLSLSLFLALLRLNFVNCICVRSHFEVSGTRMSTIVWDAYSPQGRAGRGPSASSIWSLLSSLSPPLPGRSGSMLRLSSFDAVSDSGQTESPPDPRPNYPVPAATGHIVLPLQGWDSAAPGSSQGGQLSL
jgi:hypothetical protein